MKVQAIYIHPSFHPSLCFRYILPLIICTQKLLEVVQTALDLSPRMSSQQIDTQARLLKAKISLSDFTDPQKLARFLSRFASMYDLKHTNDAAGSVNANPLLFVAAAQERKLKDIIEEQGVAPERERDGEDELATHWMVKVGEEVAGTARVMTCEDKMKVQRVAILAQFRGPLSIASSLA